MARTGKLPLPPLRSDEEAEQFVANADLTDYDLSGGIKVRYEFKPKDATLSMRIPASLLTDVKAKAQEQGIPYQRYIRSVLEQAVRKAG